MIEAAIVCLTGRRKISYRWRSVVTCWF